MELIFWVSLDRILLTEDMRYICLFSAYFYIGFVFLAASILATAENIDMWICGRELDAHNQKVTGPTVGRLTLL